MEKRILKQPIRRRRRKMTKNLAIKKKFPRRSRVTKRITKKIAKLPRKRMEKKRKKRPRTRKL